MAAPTAIGYESAKHFLDIFFSRVLEPTGLRKSDVPIALVVSLEERGKKGDARRALEIALNDCVELSIHWPASKVHSADEILKRSGAPTLSEIRLRYSKVYRALLRKGRISSDKEYYLLKGVRECAAPMLDSSTVALIDEMLCGFEDQPLGGKQKTRKG